MICFLITLYQNFIPFYKKTELWRIMEIMVEGKKRVFVTGAAGCTGIRVIKDLCEHAKDQLEIHAGIYSIRAEAQRNLLDPWKTCIEKIHPIDASNHETLVKSFEGVKDLFIIPSAETNKVEHCVSYLKAAKEADVQFVILLSVLNADHEEYLLAKQVRTWTYFLTN